MFDNCFSDETAKTINWEDYGMQKVEKNVSTGYNGEYTETLSQAQQTYKPNSSQCNLNRNENVLQSMAPNIQIIHNLADETLAANLISMLPSQPREGPDQRATQLVRRAPTGVGNINPAPQNINRTKIGNIQVVPLSCERVAPLQSIQQSVALHSYCFMKNRQNLCQHLDIMVYSTDVSPTYLLSTHQKNRLRDIMLKKNVSLADDLLPIIDHLYEMQSDPIRRNSDGQWKNNQKKQFLKENCFGYYIDVMALDAFGNYHSVAFADWVGMKRK